MYHMARSLLLSAQFVLLALLLVACAPTAPAAPLPKDVVPEAANMTQSTGDVAVPEDGGNPMAKTAPAGDAVVEPQLETATAATDTISDGQPQAAEESQPEATAATPAWQQIALTDARTGATFTLADFAGKTVYVEPMATWCSNCRKQLSNVKEARAQLGEGVVVIALSVEPNIDDAVLADYAAAAGFDWTFAAMPPALLRELAGLYGQTIANPPATPHFLIRPDGSTTELITGIDSPAALLAHVQAAQGR